MPILCFIGGFQSLGLTTNGQVYTELFLPLRISRPDFRKLVTFSNSSSWPQISHQQHTIGKSIARSSDKFKRGKRAVPPPRGVLLCGRHHLLPGEKEKKSSLKESFRQPRLALVISGSCSVSNPSSGNLGKVKSVSKDLCLEALWFGLSWSRCKITYCPTWQTNPGIEVKLLQTPGSSFAIPAIEK